MPQRRSKSEGGRYAVAEREVQVRSSWRSGSKDGAAEGASSSILKRGFNSLAQLELAWTVNLRNRQMAGPRSIGIRRAPESDSGAQQACAAGVVISGSEDHPHLDAPLTTIKMITEPIRTVAVHAKLGKFSSVP